MAVSTPRIVLIDSDAPSRKYVASILRQQGYEVETAEYAAEGLAAVRRTRAVALIVDPANLDITGEELAEKLRNDAALAGVQLIALTASEDAERMRAWMHAGFSQLLAKSPAAMTALIHSLSGLQGVDEESPPAETRGALVAFLSAKGGTGTSSLCANLTMNMAEQRPQARFVVADLVLPVGSIAGIVGADTTENLVTVAAVPSGELTTDFLKRHLPEAGTWHFRLLPGSPDPEHANQLNVGKIEEIVAMLQQVFDFVIVDLGRSLSRISLPLIERADMIVMVVGTDMSTISLSKTIWDYLRSQGVLATSVYTILNRAVGLQGMTKSEAESIIGLPIRATMPYLAENLTLANNLNTPYSLKYPGDTAAIIFRDAAGEMAALASRRHAEAQPTAA